MPVQKTREEFIVWIRMAMNDRESGAYEELYQYLWQCFERADSEKSGKITMAQFDNLIEEAAELPRIYGYAPKTEALYPSQGLRLAARKKQFNDIDVTRKGFVTLGEWIRFAIGHIERKFTQLPKDYLSGSAIGVSKEEFIEFIKKAVDPSSKEYKELYYFLLRTFQAGDKNGYGEVQPAEFDEIIECAAAAPRNFGLAPASEEIFDNLDVSLMNSVM